LAAITNASAVAANATAERMLFVSFSIRARIAYAPSAGPWRRRPNIPLTW
jgi:hypothetical protein